MMLEKEKIKEIKFYNLELMMILKKLQKCELKVYIKANKVNFRIDVDDAKEYVKTHLEESSRIFHDNNFHYCENDYEHGNRMYMVTMDHNGYYNNIIKEKIEIHKEQVY